MAGGFEDTIHIVLTNDIYKVGLGRTRRSVATAPQSNIGEKYHIDQHHHRECRRVDKFLGQIKFLVYKFKAAFKSHWRLRCARTSDAEAFWGCAESAVAARAACAGRA